MSYQAFTQLLLYKKQECALMSVFHALQYARQEAIHHNIVVQVAELSGSCTPLWNKGIEIYSIKPTALDQQKETLRLLHHAHPSMIRSNQPCGFYFLPDGRCRTPGTLTVHSHKIVISDSGRMRIKLAE